MLLENRGFILLRREAGARIYLRAVSGKRATSEARLEFVLRTSPPTPLKKKENNNFFSLCSARFSVFFSGFQGLLSDAVVYDLLALGTVVKYAGSFRFAQFSNDGYKHRFSFFVVVVVQGSAFKALKLRTISRVPEYVRECGVRPC